MANLILQKWREFALTNKSTLALNWYVKAGDYRSGFGMAALQLTVFRASRPLGTSATRNLNNPVDPVLGTLSERMNGPFYAGDGPDDVHFMGQDLAGRPIFPTMLSRDMTKWGPGVRGFPAAPFRFREELAREEIYGPFTYPVHLRYFQKLSHPHIVGGAVEMRQGRYGWQAEGTFAKPQPPITGPITGVTIPPDGVPPPGDGPPGGPPPGSPPGKPPNIPPGAQPGEEDVPFDPSFVENPYDDNIPAGEVWNPHATAMMVGGAGFRPYIPDAALASETGIEFQSNPRPNLLARFLRWVYSPGLLRGFGAQTGTRPGFGTGGMVYSGADLNPSDIYNTGKASRETPYFMLRKESIFAIGGYPTHAGGIVSGTKVSQDGSDNIAFQAVDSAGANDPLPRLTDNGDRIPRVNASASDPTVNDDESDGYFVGDGWEQTTAHTFYILTDATAGAAVWVQVQTAATGDKVTSTSTTSNTIGTGSTLTWTTADALDVGVGTWMRVMRTAAPGTTWVMGRVTNISGTSISIYPMYSLGSGTHTDWTLVLGGPFDDSGDLKARNIAPETNATYDLGTTSLRWDEVWTGKVNATNPSAWGAGRAYHFLNASSVNASVTGDEYYMCIDDHTSATADEPRAGTNRDLYWRRLEKQDRTVDFAMTGGASWPISTAAYASGTQFLCTVDADAEEITLPSTPGTDGQYGDHFWFTLYSTGGGSVDVGGLATLSVAGDSIHVKWNRDQGWYIESSHGSV